MKRQDCTNLGGKKMSKVFGYPEYDEKGEKILTTYDNEYKAMMMDIRVYRMNCLLYTSPSPRDLSTSRMPSSA